MVRYRIGRGKFLGYRVGDDGSIWSKVNGRSSRLLSEWKRLSTWGVGKEKYGKHRVVGIRRKSYLVHRLVLIAFTGPPPFADAQCRHLDGNPENNHIGNLAWGTAKENGQDRIRHGESTRGERSVTSRLTEAQVREIKKALKEGVSGGELARKFGVHPQTIYSIKYGHNWGWLCEAK